MKILVIGGTRFMGTHMIEDLRQRGHHITVATRGNIEPKDCDVFIKVDRSKAKELEEMLAGQVFDVIIDMVAYAPMDVKRLLDVVTCNRYVVMSSMSVYEGLKMDVKEEDFVASGTYTWGEREDYHYAEGKRQLEVALVEAYPSLPSVMVRYPYVVGTDDYTRRLYFYVEHAMTGKPMAINNLDAQMAFIKSDEGGQLLSYLATHAVIGPINGASYGTISIRELLDYVTQKTGKVAVISEVGDPAPYNDTPSYSLNLERLETMGFSISELKSWIYTLLDTYIEELI